MIDWLTAYIFRNFWQSTLKNNDTFDIVISLGVHRVSDVTLEDMGKIDRYQVTTKQKAQITYKLGMYSSPLGFEFHVKNIGKTASLYWDGPLQWRHMAWELHQAIIWTNTWSSVRSCATSKKFFCLYHIQKKWRNFRMTLKVGCNNDRITLKFDRHLGSAAANVPVKLQSDWRSLTPNLAVSRLHEILRCDVLPLSE